MKQLTCVRPRRLEWWDVAEPRLEADTDALVRPFIAARCDGDVVFLTSSAPRYLRAGARLHLLDPSFATPGLDPFAGPFAYGHEGVAQVVRCGSAVMRAAVGQTVIVPWALSCGACGRCRAGLTSKCGGNQRVLEAYGFGDAIGGHGGMVSDLLRVPHADHMLVPVPAGVAALSVASASDNLPDAWRTVAPHLRREPGASVLVVGGAAKSIGLYAAGLAVALGAGRVDYLDRSRTRLDIAKSLGANPIPIDGSSRWFARGVPPLSEGYAIAVEASSSTRGLDFALRALRPGGTCTAVGFYLRRGTPLPLWDMYLKSATLHVGVSNPSADLPPLMALIGAGAFRPELVTGLVAPWADAAKAFLEPSTKVIVTREPLAA